MIKKKTTLGKHRHATKVLAGNIQTWTLNTLISEYIFSIHWCWQEYLLWRIKSSFSCVANAKTPGCPSLTSRFYYFFLIHWFLITYRFSFHHWRATHPKSQTTTIYGLINWDHITLITYLNVTQYSWNISTVGDHFLYSSDLNVWFRGDILKRN